MIGYGQDVSPQNNDRDIDLDRQIGEQDARIRSNPRDAVAYRERGSFHARKRNLDHALKDLNQAVLLNPKDPRAFGLRGWVLHVLKQDKKAIADFQKAIELDPGHAEFYRSHLDKIAGSTSTDPGDAASSQRSNGATAQTGLGGFFKRLAQYYAEFLYRFQEAASATPPSPEFRRAGTVWSAFHCASIRDSSRSFGGAGEADRLGTVVNGSARHYGVPYCRKRSSRRRPPHCSASLRKQLNASSTAS